MVHGKYTIVEMINQLEDVLKFFRTHSGIVMEAKSTLPSSCLCCIRKKKDENNLKKYELKLEEREGLLKDNTYLE